MPRLLLDTHAFLCSRDERLSLGAREAIGEEVEPSSARPPFGSDARNVPLHERDLRAYGVRLLSWGLHGSMLPAPGSIAPFDRIVAMGRIARLADCATDMLHDRAKSLLTGGAMPGAESHYVRRTAWLRAAVLGANDGIISTASLIMGVAAATGSRAEILTAAVAGWAAGAMSMAAGEYVSVSSQADSETADLARERRALRERPAEEKQELAHIYEERGLKPKLAQQVASQLMAKDALEAHARDELGFSEDHSLSRSRPPSLPPSPSRPAPPCPRWRRFSRRKAPSSKRSPPPRWFFSSRSARSAPGWAARRW